MGFGRHGQWREDRAGAMRVSAGWDALNRFGEDGERLYCTVSWSAVVESVNRRLQVGGMVQQLSTSMMGLIPWHTHVQYIVSGTVTAATYTVGVVT